MRRRLLVTGTCRSGTWYLTECLLATGVNVGHEHVKPDGTVSGFMWVDHDWYPSKHERPGDPAPAAIDYVHRWHVVRNPLATIPSLAFVLANKRVQDWIASLQEVNDLPRLGSPDDVAEPWPEPSAICGALRYWVVANEYARERTDWRFRIEDLPELWPHIQQALGARAYPQDVVIPNFKGRGETTWPELFHLDRDYAHRALRLAIEFGYMEGAA